MNTNMRTHKNTIWDVAIVSTDVAQAPIAARLDTFNRHKQTLLDNLKSRSRLKSSTFDADRFWEALTDLAKLYFWRDQMKQDAIPPAERTKRLRQLETALRRARGLIDRAMKDDIGTDLFKACFAGTKMPLAAAATMDEEGSSFLISITNEVKKAAAGLATLETAARAAALAANTPTKVGRPPVLPRDCIHGLARVYRSSTGSRPGRGNGPFARFVFKFLTAVDRPGNEFDYDSVVGAIKNAHLQSKPSMFDE